MLKWIKKLVNRKQDKEIISELDKLCDVLKANKQKEATVNAIKKNQLKIVEELTGEKVL